MHHRLHSKAARQLGYSQLSFFVMLLVCLLLAPEVISGNLGISYFGIHARTLLPYMLGLSLTSYFMVRSARSLPITDPLLKRIADVLVVMAILILGILLTPYSFGPLFNLIHEITSAILFICELGFVLWLMSHIPRTVQFVCLLTMQSIGALIAMVSLLTSVELMFTGQIITQMAFGILLIKAIDKLAQ